MGYADRHAAAYDIGLVDDTASLERLDDEISRAIDLKCGRSFGTPAAPAARIVRGPLCSGEAVLTLPIPIRSVTTIVITGDDAETLASTDFTLYHVTRRGDAHAIRRIDGYGWPRDDGANVITITGQWSDAADGAAVPAEIVTAATFILIEEWKLRNSSAAGEIGPEGMSVPVRNPWNFELVKTAIERYKAAVPVVGF